MVSDSGLKPIVTITGISGTTTITNLACEQFPRACSWAITNWV